MEDAPHEASEEHRAGTSEHTEENTGPFGGVLSMIGSKKDQAKAEAAKAKAAKATAAKATAADSEKCMKRPASSRSCMKRPASSAACSITGKKFIKAAELPKGWKCFLQPGRKDPSRTDKYYSDASGSVYRSMVEVNRALGR